MYKIWLMPMSFKIIFCISQLFYNGPSIVNLHAPMSERTIMNESSQAHLASLNLNRLRRWTFIVTRKGNYLLRTTLNVCAHSAAKGKNSYFRAQFQRINAHRGSKKPMWQLPTRCWLPYITFLKMELHFRIWVRIITTNSIRNAKSTSTWRS